MMVLNDSCNETGAPVKKTDLILSGNFSANNSATIPPKLCPMNDAFLRELLLYISFISSNVCWKLNFALGSVERPSPRRSYTITKKPLSASLCAVVASKPAQL